MPYSRTRRCVCRKHSRLMAIIASMAVSACATGPAPPAAVAIAPVQVDIAQLPGAYGLASYHRIEDRERTIEQAKIACNNPYTIGAGSNGGVLMHGARQTRQSEMYLKRGPDVRSYLGPQGPAGIAQDRLVVSYDDRVLVTEWLDPDLRTSYGTMVLVPCAET